MGSHSGFEHYHLAYATGAFLLDERRIVADTMLIAVIYEPHGQEGMTFLNDDACVYANGLKYGGEEDG